MHSRIPLSTIVLDARLEATSCLKFSQGQRYLLLASKFAGISTAGLESSLPTTSRAFFRSAYSPQPPMEVSLLYSNTFRFPFRKLAFYQEKHTKKIQTPEEHMLASRNPLKRTFEAPMMYALAWNVVTRYSSLTKPFLTSHLMRGLVLKSSSSSVRLSICFAAVVCEAKSTHYNCCPVIAKDSFQASPQERQQEVQPAKNPYASWRPHHGFDVVHQRVVCISGGRKVDSCGAASTTQYCIS